MVELSRLFHGYYAVPVLAVFGELGLADRWAAGESIDIAGFIRDQNLDADLVDTVVDYMSQYRYLQRDVDGKVSPTPTGAAVFKEWPRAMLQYAHICLVTDLIEMLRKEKQYGRQADLLRVNHRQAISMERIGFNNSIYPNVFKYLKEQKIKCIADLGSGDSLFLAMAAKEVPGLKVVGLDNDADALKRGQGTMVKKGLEGRSAFIKADALKPETYAKDPAFQDVELATLIFLFHEYTHSRFSDVVSFLKTWREINPKKKLGVGELYSLTDPDMQLFMNWSAMPEVHMFHRLSKQKTLPREQWMKIFDDCGYKLTGTLPAVGWPANVPAVTEMSILEPR